MYSDEDLSNAVKDGIIDAKAVDAFRSYIANKNNTVSVDEENFRLVTSFNDIYVVIACALMLLSIAWFGRTISDLTGALLFSVAAWALAEYFVQKRHMALPAIALLLSFLSGVIASTLLALGPISETSLLISGIVTAFAAWLHWRRFQVPITVAGGTAALIGCLLSITLAQTDANLEHWFAPLLLLSGLVTFAYAMYWDNKDRLRKNRQSDVAFWLHLLSAPLIVHPIFSILGILEGQTGLFEASMVIVLYLMMAIVSVAIDRRAILVSGLAYVLFAISTLLDSFGLNASSSAITGIVIGGALLLLSVYWHTTRNAIFNYLPASLKSWIPPLSN
jgi:MFS family permease